MHIIVKIRALLDGNLLGHNTGKPRKTDRESTIRLATQQWFDGRINSIWTEVSAGIKTMT